MRKYFAAHRDELSAARREKRKSPEGDKIRAAARAKYARNKAKVRKQQKEAWARNKDYFNRRQNARRYKLSLEEYDALMARSCAICTSTEGLHIDHCHETGVVRGVLCTRCNTGIGLFRENGFFLRMAIKYLAQAQGGIGEKQA